MTRTPGERLRRLWATAGPVRDGALPVAVATLAEDLRVVLPTDFADYLTIVDGMDGGQWVGNLIEMWTVARLRYEANEWGCFEPGVPGTLLPFGDFLINSHAYAIRVSSTDAAVFIVHGGRHPPIQCAESFDEFVTRYEQDHIALHG